MDGTQASVAARVRDTATELRDLADGAGLPLLAQLLSMVILEAENVASANGKYRQD